MSEVGLLVWEDVIGNIFGCWEGIDLILFVVGFGFYMDVIFYVGKYDGVLGVLGVIYVV